MIAQVRFIRLSRNASEPYQVGVELKTPGNVWGIELPPQDWLQCFERSSNRIDTRRSVASRRHTADWAKEPRFARSSGIKPATLASVPAEIIQQPSDAPPGWPVRDAAPDEVRRTVDAKLLQAAEKAVSLAVISHVNTAITQAVNAIETFAQATLRDAEQHCLIYSEKLVTTAREQLEATLAEAQSTAQRLEKSL